MDRLVSAKPRVLVLVGHYLPGFRAGGPIRSLAGLVDRLGDEFEFLVLTSDRDLGDREPYPGVAAGTWQTVGKARVRYLPRRDLGFLALSRLLRTLDYDVAYALGFFSRLTRVTLLARRLGLISDTPMVVWPQGEFSRGALALKAYKKRLYLMVARLVGLCRGVSWQASSEHEARDIDAVFGSEIVRDQVPVTVAPDIAQDRQHLTNTQDPSQRGSQEAGGGEPGSAVRSGTGRRARPKKRPGEARLVFISRVSPMKNLRGALAMLQSAEGRVDLDIYGPIEHAGYWRECQALIAVLPPGVHASYLGELRPEMVVETFSTYHAFLFPTLGENFGHVVPEALGAGCLVITSDRTPWRGLEEKGVGWDIPLDQPEKFRDVLRKCVEMGPEEFERLSKCAARFALSQGCSEGLLDQYRKMFRRAAGTIQPATPKRDGP